MKRLFFFLFSLFLLSGNALAQTPSFDFVHTAEDDGYFAVEIFPADYTQPLPIEDIFVINYENEDNNRYKSILRVIQNLGSTIITKEKFESLSQNQSLKRYILLGESEDDHLSFNLPKENGLEAFEQFINEELQPVFIGDMEVHFGGNVYEVYPEDIQYGFERGTLLVGRYKTPIKTRFELRGNTSNGYIITNTILDFTNPIYSTDYRAEALPELWYQQKKLMNPVDETKLARFFKWTNLFPIILAAIGISIIIAGLVLFGRRLREESLLPVDFLDDAPDSVIDEDEKELFREEDSLPFEVHLREKK